MVDLKGRIRAFWSAQVPYLEEGRESAPVGSRDFYIAADAKRCRYESYLPAYLTRLADGGGTLIEVGFGLGGDLRYLARKGMRVVGADLSPSNARIAQGGFDSLELPGQTLAADGESLPFLDNSFDAAYSFGALHHTPDTFRAIAELRRVLKPQGRCLVMLYHQGLAYRLIALKHAALQWFGHGRDREAFISRAYDQTPLSKLYSRADLLALFSGFHDVRIAIENYGGLQGNKMFFWVYHLLQACPPLKRKLGSFAMVEAVK
jgi:ubiquinone/menaquinone biosynthesis C-methylase UbiE